MTLAASGTLLPVWVVLPAATVTMVVIGAHVVSLQRADGAGSGGSRRRRIRTAAGILMMVVTALLAWALCIDPFVDHPATQPRAAADSLLVWLTIVSLVGVIVILAGLDALHTLSLSYLAGRKIKNAMVARAALEAAERARARKGADGSGGGDGARG